jgi:hypothetical protein
MKPVLDSLASAIFVANVGGGSPVSIIAAGTGIGSDFRRVGNPDINNAGLIAFGADPLFNAILPHQGDEGLFVTDGATVQSIVPLFSNDIRFVSWPEINDDGAVAFFGEQDLNHGIFFAQGGSITTIGDIDGIFSYLPEPPFSFQPPSLNNSEQVAFQGTLDGGSFSNLLWTNGSLTTIVDISGPHDFLGQPSINDQGDVLFLSFFGFDVGGSAIFRGPDVAADRIVGYGDPLFGSTISEMIGDPVLNDAGQFAFTVRLADDRWVLVRADPLQSDVIPEPSSLLLLGVGVLGLATRRSVRSRSCNRTRGPASVVDRQEQLFAG